MGNGADDPMRLFVGVEVPSPANRSIDALARQWRGSLPRARWSPAEDRHVTLMFIGDVAAAVALDVGERLLGVARGSAAFETTIQGVGAFPSAARARVVWIGLSDPDGAWAALVSEVHAALSDFAPTPPGPFVPHITLARSARPIALPRALVTAAEPRAAFTVDALTLFRSRPDRAGPRYERLERFGLDTVP